MFEKIITKNLRLYPLLAGIVVASSFLGLTESGLAKTKESFNQNLVSTSENNKENFVVGQIEQPQQPPTNVPGDGQPQQPPTNVPGDGQPQQPPTNVPGDGQPQQPPINVPGDGQPQQPPTNVPGDGQPQQPPTNVPGNGQPQQPPQTTPNTSNEKQPEEQRVIVAEVLVQGTDNELTDLVYKTIATKPGRTTTRSQLQKDVNSIFATGYFSNVNVYPEDTPLGVRITFTVVTNPILNKVDIETVPAKEGDPILPPEVVNNIFSPRYGKVLNLNELKEDIKKLNKWYTDSGFDLAQVVGSPKISEDGTVSLVIAEGAIENIKVRYFNADQETVEGKTRDFIITREIELKPGDIFNRNKAQKDLQRVYGLGLFEDVKFSFTPGEDPSKVIVNVDVVEGSSGSLAAGAGFSSSSGFFGTISYQQKNLGGNNQTLGTEIQLGTRELLFDANFTDPWIGGDSYRTSYTINAFRRRSVSLVFDGDGTDVKTLNGDDSPRVVRSGGGITFARPLSKNVYEKADWRLSLGFEYQHVQIQNADGDEAPLSQNLDLLAFSEDASDDLFTFKLGASLDRRNNPLQPTNGSLLRLSMDQTVPIGSGSILLNRVRGSYSYYIPVNYINFSEGAQALAFNVQAGTIFGDLPPYEAFTLGGSNSVRGYAEGTVGSGSSYLQATAEYRFPLFSVVGAALFFDYGTNLGTANEVPGNPSDRRGLPGSGFGYGVGVRIQSPLGPIRVDYAVNDEGDDRIHFGIGERF